MDMNVEFHPVFVDDLACIAELDRKVREEIAFQLNTLTKVKLRIRETAIALAQADLPAGVEIRMSCSTWYSMTLVISGLDSFHDMGEVLQAISNDRSNLYRSKEPEMLDDPHGGTRSFIFEGWMSWRSVTVKCCLGEERDGCKVKTITRKKMVQVSEPTYAEKEVEETLFVCPGEDGYDDL